MYRNDYDINQVFKGAIYSYLNTTVNSVSSWKFVHLPPYELKLVISMNYCSILHRSITRSYYRNSAGAILVYDVTNRDSFNHIENWMEEAKLHVAPNNIVFTLVGQKCDLEEERVVSIFFQVWCPCRLIMCNSLRLCK